MARRSVTGQLNMFELLNSLEAASGEVEMVSLVPEFEDEVQPLVEELPTIEETLVIEESPVVEEPPVVENHSTQDDLQVAMSRCYEIEGKKIELAYINYNKVRITRGTEAPVIKEFSSSKEAVDYYVEQMQGYEADE